MNRSLARVFSIAAALVLALPAFAGTFIVPDDWVLVERAEGVVTATVESSEGYRTPEGGVRTRVGLLVDEAIKGRFSQGQVVEINELGGEAGGRSLRLNGVPVYQPGDRVLVMLGRDNAGRLTTLEFALGKFGFVESGGESYLVRDADQICGWGTDRKPYRERARRAGAFLDHVRSVVAGRRLPIDYYAADDACVSSPESISATLPATATSYLFCDCRWSVFTPPTQTITFLTSGTQKDVADSLGSVTRGTGVWTNDAGSTVQYQRGGTSAITQAFQTFDDVNVVVFNDPSNEIPGSFNGSGTLAIGGPWFDTGTRHTFNGESIGTTGGADLVVQNDVSPERGISQSQFDSIIAHELGHTLGFRHSEAGAPAASNALMAAVLQAGPGNASLLQWDIDAVRTVYGSSSSGGAACTPGTNTLCLDDASADRRFKAAVSFQTTQNGGQSGQGKAIQLNTLGVTRGGLFWFFDPANPELLIKVLNGCGVNSRYWIFYSAGTNVGMTITVTDTKSGTTKSYTNKDLTAAVPVQDTNAFACN
jgi:hypothetical protein